MIIDVMSDSTAARSGRLGIIDSYISLSWIDRYYSAGECTLVVGYTSELFDLLSPRNVLYTPFNGKQAMYITSRKVQKKQDTSDEYTITVTAKDPRIFLSRRIIRQGYPMDSQYILFDEIRTFVDQNMGLASGSRRSLNSYLRLKFPTGQTTPSTTVIYIPAGVTIEEAIRRAAQQDDIGWVQEIPSGLYPTIDYRTLIYEGGQDKPGVIFSSEYDSGYLEALETVMSPYPNWAMAYGDGVFTSQRKIESDPSGPSGFARFETSVSVSGVKPAPEDSPKWADLLRGAAAEAIKDGSRVPNIMEFKSLGSSPYKYGQDYNVGDMVRVESKIGNIARTSARVIEYVKSDTEAGYVEYPVLSVTL